MHVSVNGVRLFFDVEGAKLVPDGPVMREKPVLSMLAARATTSTCSRISIASSALPL